MDDKRDDPIANSTGTGWAGRPAVPRYTADENAPEPRAEALDDEYPTADLADLESRVEALENLIATEERDDLEERDSEGGRTIVGSGFYAVGSALAVILSWQTFHALLWAILAGCLSWFYVIYFVVMHWSEVKFL